MSLAKLEHEAQMFGLRGKTSLASGMRSPQHLQIREFIRLCEVSFQGLN